MRGAVCRSSAAHGVGLPNPENVPPGTSRRLSSARPWPGREFPDAAIIPTVNSRGNGRSGEGVPRAEPEDSARAKRAGGVDDQGSWTGFVGRCQLVFRLQNSENRKWPAQHLDNWTQLVVKQPLCQPAATHAAQHLYRGGIFQGFEHGPIPGTLHERGVLHPPSLRKT